MNRNWTGVVPQNACSEASSDLTTKVQGLDWQSKGIVGRIARNLVDDDVFVQGQKNSCLDSLFTSPLFMGLSPSAGLELCDSAIERSFSNRKVIFHEDDPVQFVDVVVRGSVKITKLSPEGDEVILRIERAGSPIDGMGEISEKAHLTTAWAVRECTLLSWDAAVFANFAQKFPAIHRNATAIMAKRLKALSESFCDLSTARVPQRLARVLLRLAGEDSGLHEPLGLSREELAQMTGTSLFTTSRLLREWADSDIVYVSRSGVVIEDLRALTSLSQEQGGGERQDPDLSRRPRKIWQDASHGIIREIDQRAAGTYDL